MLLLGWELELVALAVQRLVDCMGMTVAPASFRSDPTTDPADFSRSWQPMTMNKGDGDGGSKPQCSLC